ncbi:MAG: peptidoglycan/LPS O-acetylase OafA/YrhL [Myxococcota bacterium]
MFGSFRFVLALLVVVTHLSHFSWPGIYAVFGFYLISGYLMCLVMNQRYGFSLVGLRGYLTNRFLRIYPPYWVACIASAVLIAALGQPAAAVFWGPWQVPPTAMDWIDNLLIITLPMGADENRLVPAGWALRVELFYYAAIALGLGRGPRIAIVWVLGGVVYHAFLFHTGAEWSAKYFPIAAASLPFSLGALLYHFRESIGARLRGRSDVLVAISIVWLFNMVYSPMAVGTVLGPIRFYLNLACVATIAAALCMRTIESRRLRALDTRLGDLAYPIYLLHMQVGLAVSNSGLLPGAKTPMLIMVSLLPILFASWLVVRFVGDPVENLRRTVRSRFAVPPGT